MLQGFADSFGYTDENGITWVYNVDLVHDVETTGLKATDSARIISCYTESGIIPETLVVPEKVKLNDRWITVKAIDGFSKDCIKVILPNTVSRIGREAFEGCSNLTKVQLANCDEIGYQAFNGCSNLKEINLESCKFIDEGAFNGCESLTSIDLANCESIGKNGSYANGAFIECKSLTTVKNATKVKEIAEWTFGYCDNLTEIDLPSCKTLGEYAFYGCSCLTKISIPNCISLNNLAFGECSSLKEINLPVCQSIDNEVFRGCNSLSEITLSDQIKDIGKNAFGAIEKVTINSTNVPTFEGGLNNTIIFVPKEVQNAYKNSDNWKDYAGKIFAIGEETSYDVTTTALNNAPGLLQQLDRDKLNNIVSLKVSGTINGYDIMLFRNKMDNLHHLDLSDVDIVANPYEYYEGYCTQDSILGYNAFSNLSKIITVKCPNSVKQIYGAFNGCSNLRSVSLPEQLEYIGDKVGAGEHGSFKNCFSLANVTFKNCQEIGNYTFESCSSLQHIELPEGITRIGEDAFSQCRSLESIILPNGVETLEMGAFEFCESLTKVSFPPSLKTIGWYAFRNCSSLDSISLPGLTRIEYNAFNGCKNLKELKVPSTLESIGDGAFGDCSLEKVYTYTVLPVNISQSTFSNFQNIALYVPTQSVDNYYLNTQWSQFKEIHEFDEPYTYFYLDKEFTLEKRFDGTPDIDIKEDGGLKVDGKDNQEAGDVTIKGDGDKGNSGTLITDGNLNAKMMRFDISVTANKWYFFSFPFDINMANVKAPGEYKWKRYDGKIRSDQGSGGWVDLASNEEWLKQGDGYIFQTNKEGILTLRVTKEKFGQLDATNIMKPLDAYPSGNIADASWNFIGNPQTSYFNVNDLGYDAPITVWNGNSYEAVRPGDDDYTLHPFQAFFVQKPAETSGIEFKAEDRLTKTGSQIRAQETKARRLARGVMPSRLIINLNVTDGTQTDKTRVVFNNQKSRDYEIDCDAAKFMTMGNAPQLYSVEGKGTQYAINERPMGSVQLGFTAKKSGTFTISAARMDQPMLLEDKQAGITFDLTNGDYEFTSGAGTFNSRFMLIPSRGTTGIADIVSKTGVSIMPTEEGLYINGTNGKSVQVFNLNGIEMANRSTDGMLNLATGVYIVKVNGMSTKVMVK